MFKLDVYGFGELQKIIHFLERAEAQGLTLSELRTKLYDHLHQRRFDHNKRARMKRTPGAFLSQGNKEAPIIIPERKDCEEPGCPGSYVFSKVSGVDGISEIIAKCGVCTFSRIISKEEYTEFVTKQFLSSPKE